MVGSKPWLRGCEQIEAVGVRGAFEVKAVVEAQLPMAVKTPASTLLSGSAFWRFFFPFSSDHLNIYAEDGVGFDHGKHICYSFLSRSRESGEVMEYEGGWGTVACWSGSRVSFVCLFPGSF